MKQLSLGQTLSSLRKSRGYTQQEIADKLDISNKTVSSWECDISQPDAGTIPLIAKIYGVSCDVILTGTLPVVSTEINTAQKSESRSSVVIVETNLNEKTARKKFSRMCLSVALNGMWYIIICILAYIFRIFFYTEMPSVLVTVNEVIDLDIVVYLVALAALTASVIFTTVRYVIIDYPLRECKEAAFGLRRKLLFLQKLSTFPAFVLAFALLPFTTDYINKYTDLQYVLFYGVVIALISLFPLALLNYAIRYFNRNLYGISDAKPLKKRIVTTFFSCVALCVCVVTVTSVVYTRDFLSGLNNPVGDTFDTHAEMEDALSYDPIYDFAQSSIIDFEYSISEDERVRCIYYIEKSNALTAANVRYFLLSNNYPEYYIRELKDTIELGITYQIATYEYGTTPDNNKNFSGGSIIVTNPRYFGNIQISYENECFKLIPDKSYYDLGYYQRVSEFYYSSCFLAISVVLCGSIYLALLFRIRKKEKKQTDSN